MIAWRWDTKTISEALLIIETFDPGRLHAKGHKHSAVPQHRRAGQVFERDQHSAR